MDYEKLQKLAVAMNAPRKISHAVRLIDGATSGVDEVPFYVRQELELWVESRKVCYALHGWLSEIFIDDGIVKCAINKPLSAEWKAVELLCLCRRVQVSCDGGKALVRFPSFVDVIRSRSPKVLEEYCLKNIYELLFDSGLEARSGTAAFREDLVGM